MKKIAALLILSSSAFASVVYVGGDTATRSAWRTTSTVKPLDIDANNIYGSDGYLIVAVGGNLSQLPSYLSAITRVAPSEFAALAYAAVDKPSGGTVNSGLWYDITNSATELDYASFTLSSAASFRVGVMLDNSNVIDVSPGSLRIRQTVGGAANSGLNASNLQLNLLPDWYFFDVSGVAGDVFVVSGLPSGTGVTAIGGLTFDSTAVPEPASWTLLTFGLGALVLRKRGHR